MKRIFYSLLLLLAVLSFSTVVQAKKIKYGAAIIYDGKAKSDIPTGEGTLTTTCGNYTDVLVGTFVGDGSVTNAQLKFPSGWKFQGSLNYEVEIDGSKVTYTLNEGDLYIVSASKYKNNIFDVTLKVDPARPITLVRTPLASSIDLKQFVFNTTIPGSLVDNEFSAPLKLSDIGNKNTATAEANCTILPTSKVNYSSSGTDPIRNLIEKGFAGITEPWTFLKRPSKVTLVDSTTIERMVLDDEEYVIKIEYANNDIFWYHYDEKSNKKGTVEMLLRSLDDGNIISYVDDDTYPDTWFLLYPDKSRASGDIRLSNGVFIISDIKKMSDYDAKTVFNIVMKASSLASFSPRLINGTVTKEDGTKVNYRRGFNEEELVARAEARQKALEEDKTLALVLLDVVGQWKMTDAYQMGNSYCYFTLDLSADNIAMLELSANYYGTGTKDLLGKPYYASKTFKAVGTFKLMDNRIMFNWDPSQKTATNLIRKYNTDGTIPATVKTNADAKENQFTQMLNTILSTAIVSSITDRQLTITGNGMPVVFTRDGGLDEEMTALKKAQKSNEYFKMNTTTGTIKAFKHYFDDGVVTFDTDNEGKWFIIEYNNGDKYEGGGTVGLFDGDGTLVNSYGRVSDYQGFCQAILEIPTLSDLQVRYWYGTLTKANGTVLKFDHGMTDRQINQFAKNIGTISDIIDQEIAASCKQLKEKSMATKKQLLSEGFAPTYVNSMFDQFRILTDTPKALIDRAIQLGCHITRHPVVMEDAHFNWKKSGETYAIVITNYNTGNDAFEGFVKFHWLSNRVMYVGKQIQ